ncbi:MAG: YggT family protein [Anaerolineales bacterium]
MSGFAAAISLITTALSILIIADVLVSYILDPYHPLRRFLDSIVQPLLLPIQRILPPIGGLDLSPLVLLIVLDLISRALRDFLS